jgi:ribosomal protein S18 acetylase RimI-like enzyme
MVRYRVDERATEQDGLLLWPLQHDVFGGYEDHATWAADVWDRHRRREGFRLVRALDGDTVAGFAYGYTGRPGQWWTDEARGVLDPEVADAWLGGHFEVVSIGVARSARSRGVGRELLRRLTDPVPHERQLLMATRDERDPARRLYASEGWRVLGPGTSEASVILGRRRPTRQAGDWVASATQGPSGGSHVRTTRRST